MNYIRMVQQNVSLNEKEVKRPVLNDGITLTNTEKNKFETYADDFEGNETSRKFLVRLMDYSDRNPILKIWNIFPDAKNPAPSGTGFFMAYFFSLTLPAFTVLSQYRSVSAS